MNQHGKLRDMALFFLALATGILPFLAPEACGQALREGLSLCGGPLLLSLFPFLVVSRLLMQCPGAEILSLPFRSAARLIGIRAPCAARVLCIGFLGGFAPAASAASQAVRSGQLTPRQADALLPACVCSSPSFVILTVGQALLGSAELGFLLFLAQTAAGYLTAALLCRCAPGVSEAGMHPVPAQAEPPQLDRILADSSVAYLKLCGFILYFRMLAAGAGALLPPGAGVFCAMVLEVCSGCDLAARTGRWGSLLCCAALSVQGLSVLLQVAHPLPALHDAAAAVSGPPAPSSAVAGDLLPASARRGAERVQHPAAPGHPHAAGAGRLCASGFCGVLSGRLRADTRPVPHRRKKFRPGLYKFAANGIIRRKHSVTGRLP